MRMACACCLLWLFMAKGWSQTARVTYQSTKHYAERVAAFERMRAIDSSDVVMLGNSLTEMAGDWNKKLKAKRVKNRGITGDDATGMLNRLQQILPGKPKAVFLMVGINDLSHGLTLNQVYEQCLKVIERIRAEAPQTKLYIQSILPINESFGRWKTLEGKTNDIPVINTLLKAYCTKNGITYINLFDKFVRHGTNEMRKELTTDGLHLTPFGYKVWTFEIKKYFR